MDILIVKYNIVSIAVVESQDHLDPVFSTLIGRAPTKLGSHWSRGSECCLRQQSYALKNQLVASKAPY